MSASSGKGAAATLQACRDAPEAYLRGEITYSELRQRQREAYTVYADCSASCDAAGANEALAALNGVEAAATGARP